MKKVVLEVYQGTPGGWYWRLVAGNGEIVADGSESYVEKADAKKAAVRARKLMGSARLAVV